MRGLTPASLLGVWEVGVREAPHRRALMLLAAALDRTAEHAAAVDVGSREALLARHMESAGGGPAWALVDCGGCGHELDVPVDIAAVAQMPVHKQGELFRAAVDGDAISFRLPTAADLESVASSEPVQARRLLLTQCIRWGDGELPEAVVAAVEAAMEEASPGGAVEIAVRCPSCVTVTTTTLDVSVLLWAEVEAQALALIQDVDTLARAYGWTEADVVGLSAERRAAYLDLAGA